MNDLDILYKRFVQEKKSYCSDRTIEYYKVNIKDFIDYYLINHKTYDIGFISRNDFINYIYYLRNKRELKNTSIRTYCRAIKVFANYLLDNEYIEFDFTYKVKMPRPDNKIIIPLSDQEVSIIDNSLKLETKIGLRNYLIIHFMLDMGLRLSEVINLRFKDLDYVNSLVVINNSKFNKSRILPLPNCLKDMIINYQLMNKEKRIYYFVTDDKKKLTKDTIKNLFRRLKDKSEIERLHPHLLRHTFATSYIMGGGSLENLRVLLGHSDYNVTKNYLHISTQQKLIHYDIYKLDKIYFQNYNSKEVI